MKQETRGRKREIGMRGGINLDLFRISRALKAMLVEEKSLEDTAEMMGISKQELTKTIMAIQARDVDGTSEWDAHAYTSIILTGYRSSTIFFFRMYCGVLMPFTSSKETEPSCQNMAKSQKYLALPDEMRSNGTWHKKKTTLPDFCNSLSSS